MEQSGGEQEPGAVRYRALNGPREGKETRGRAAESLAGPGLPLASRDSGVQQTDSHVTAARRRQRRFPRRLLDLPWEDVLLPHVLTWVPLRQLLRLQRVSRAFRALVQLHLAGLRRFDAAQVSREPQPRPRVGPTPVWSRPLPASSPAPPGGEQGAASVSSLLGGQVTGPQGRRLPGSFPPQGQTESRCLPAHRWGPRFLGPR